MRVTVCSSGLRHLLVGIFGIAALFIASVLNAASPLISSVCVRDSILCIFEQDEGWQGQKTVPMSLVVLLSSAVRFHPCIFFPLLSPSHLFTSSPRLLVLWLVSQGTLSDINRSLLLLASQRPLSYGSSLIPVCPARTLPVHTRQQSHLGPARTFKCLALTTLDHVARKLADQSQSPRLASYYSINTANEPTIPLSPPHQTTATLPFLTENTIVDG